MSSFSTALSSFRLGEFSLEQLEGQIERNIALGAEPAEAMLNELEAHNSGAPFDEATYTGIRQLIMAAETRRRTQTGMFSQPGDDLNRTRVTGSAGQSGLKTGAIKGGSQNFLSRTATETPAPPLSRPPTVGDTINQRFVLEELIGSGGMSQVFKAVDKRKLEASSREPHIALKVMRVEGVDPSEAFVAMQREVQKSQSLSHPNILRVNDFDRDGSVVYMTMELLQGQSLRQVIANAKNQQLPLDDALRMINEMSEALAYAHENRIVHADFKPSNVFLNDNNQIKVIDFGIARALEAPDAPEEERTVFDPQALGALTPAYASPEMLEALPTDPRDDIYAIGCVAYELIAGRHPYSKLQATDARDNEHELRRPQGLNKSQWTAIEGALQFKREDRIPSVRQFLDLLNATPTATPKLAMVAGLFGIVALLAVAGWFWLQQPGADPLITDCAQCPSLLTVEAGSTQIGAQRNDQPGMFEYPVHTVTIERAFAMGHREVTVGQYRAFSQATNRPLAGGCRTSASDWRPNPSRSWQSPGFTQTEAHPVTCVSWQDAQDYASWLSTSTGQTYRLPSEAEWEYVAREFANVSETPISTASDSNNCTQTNVADQSLRNLMTNVDASLCNDGFTYTAPTNRHTSDNFADMRGNLFEWTSDCWNPSYLGAPQDGSAWQRGDCESRILRGGSWFTSPAATRLTYRNRYPVDYRSNTFGMRIVKELNSKELNNAME